MLTIYPAASSTTPVPLQPSLHPGGDRSYVGDWLAETLPIYLTSIDELARKELAEKK